MEEKKLTFDPKKIDLAEASLAAYYKRKNIFIDPQDGLLKTERLKLSLPSLNFVLSGYHYGEKAGFPLGCIVNLYGYESLGKSALAYVIASHVLKAGGAVHWIDREGSFDSAYVEKAYGIKVDCKDKSFTVSVPESAEEALNIIQALVENNSVNLIVLDSVAALSTVDQQDKYAEESPGIASVARLLSGHFSKVTALARKNRISIIYINQLRANLASMVGSKTFTGGNAMKFYAHVALELSKTKGGKIQRGDQYIGEEVRVTATKNKTAKPYLFANLFLYPGEGFSREMDILNLAIQADIVKKSGSWLSFGDEKIGQGLENCRLTLKEKPELLQAIESEVEKVFCTEELTTQALSQAE